VEQRSPCIACLKYMHSVIEGREEKRWKAENVSSVDTSAQQRRGIYFPRI